MTFLIELNGQLAAIPSSAFHFLFKLFAYYARGWNQNCLHCTHKVKFSIAVKTSRQPSFRKTTRVSAMTPFLTWTFTSYASSSLNMSLGKMLYVTAFISAALKSFLRRVHQFSSPRARLSQSILSVWTYASPFYPLNPDHKVAYAHYWLPTWRCSSRLQLSVAHMLTNFSDIFFSSTLTQNLILSFWCWSKCRKNFQTVPVILRFLKH